MQPLQLLLMPGADSPCFSLQRALTTRLFAFGGPISNRLESAAKTLMLLGVGSGLICPLKRKLHRLFELTFVLYLAGRRRLVVSYL